MRILFVDDEPRVLEGLQRMLFHLEDEWEMFFAESGQEALEFLAEEELDVIVTDMRMPGMDGAELLQRVHDEYPDLVRIVLSGHAELEMALRAVPVAHQFLTKPCKAEVLEEVVARASSLQAILENHLVRKVVGQIENLPVLPQNYRDLTIKLTDPDATAKDVAAIIERDPAMCAKMLQFVNSAFFTRASTISSVQQAVVQLGFQMVKNLVLTVEVFKSAFIEEHVLGFSLDALQAHSMRVARLGMQMFEDRQRSDDAFMAGILHDIGKLLMGVAMPERYKEVSVLARTERISYLKAERQIFLVSHAEVGAYLLGLWGLPYPIVEAVSNHHEPKRVPSREFDLLGGVYAANAIVNGMDIDLHYLEVVGALGRLQEWRDLAATKVVS